MLSPVRDSFDNYKVTLDISANTGINRSSYQRCSIRKDALKHFPKFEACNFISKETLTQVFFCEFCKNFKKNFFTENIYFRCFSNRPTAFSRFNSLHPSSGKENKTVSNEITKLLKIIVYSIPEENELLAGIFTRNKKYYNKRVILNFKGELKPIIVIKIILLMFICGDEVQ